MARLLGLDIGDKELRSVVVHTSFRTIEVERYIAIPLTHEPGNVGRAIDLSETVEGLLSVLDDIPDMVITALPGDQVSIKTVQIPVAAAKHISQVLPLELESVLPFSAEETVIDYQSIETKAGQMNLLVGAVLRERMAEYLKEMNASGIEPREVVAGATALEGLTSLIPELKSQTPVLVADIGRKQTDLCVLRNGRCQTARTLSVGFEKLSERSEELWRGFQRTVFSYRSSGMPPIEKIFLTGVGSTAEDITRWLEGKLEIEVTRLPLPNATVSRQGPRPEFARATALAGRGLVRHKTINLRQSDFAVKRSASVLLRHSSLLSLCTLAVLFSIVFSIYAQRSLLADEQAALRAKLSEITKQVFGTAADEPFVIEKLISKTGANDPLPRYDAFNALDTLSETITENIVHDISNLRIEIGDEKHEGRFELKGTLGSIEQRDEVATKLEAHECFSDVKKGRTTTARDKDRINYQLEAVIQCPGDASSKSSKKSRRKSD